jgi:hypothetical protein
MPHHETFSIPNEGKPLSILKFEHDLFGGTEVNDSNELTGPSPRNSLLFLFSSLQEGAKIKTKGGNTYNITAQGWNAFKEG